MKSDSIFIIIVCAILLVVLLAYAYTIANAVKTEAPKKTILMCLLFGPLGALIVAANKSAPGYPEEITIESVRRRLVEGLELSSKEVEKVNPLISSFRIPIPHVDDAVTRVLEGYRIDQSIEVDNMMTLESLAKSIYSLARVPEQPEAESGIADEG